MKIFIRNPFKIENQINQIIEEEMKRNEEYILDCNNHNSNNEKTWDWDNFKSTENFPISDNLLDWVIGQDRALKESYLCLDEWTHKLKWLEKENIDISKGIRSEIKLVPAGPYLLLLGDAGTGKSLIGRALASYLTKLYKKHDIKLQDVVCRRNEIIPSEPKVEVYSAGKGKEIVYQEKKKAARKGFLKRWAVKALMGIMIGAGLFMIGAFAYYIHSLWSRWCANPSIWSWDLEQFTSLRTIYPNIFQYILEAVSLNSTLLYLLVGGATTLGMAIFVWYFGRLGQMNSGLKGVGGAEVTEAPKLLIDNSKEEAPFIDATGHTSSQLFGDIAWDPYQTGGLGTPEHQRVSAGDVHRANLGILYIDEIKNLHPEEATTLLTVLEDGRLPVALRSRWHGGGTAAMAVATEPVPCLCFLIGAGNFDSIPNIHPALMDRIYGYGKVVRMNNDMPNTLKNRRKYVQFIAQEAKRYHLPPFSREACEEIVAEGRRKSGKRDALTTKFRPLISIIKTAATLALNEKLKIVDVKHVKEAINEHCKTIQKQLQEHYIEERGKFLEISPSESPRLGQIYGLSVTADPYSNEMTGMVLSVKGFLEKKHKFKDVTEGYYKVTGIATPETAQWITASVDKVRSVILQKYHVDVANQYFAHIDFAQAYGIDGPSAGVTMTILLCSLLEGKPIRQDVAVTGEINIGVGDEIKVTAVGGVHEKIKAAEMLGFKKVCIPDKNLKYSIDPNDYTIEVIGCSNLDDYLLECLVR